MIRTKVWGAVLACGLFASCEEIGPAINFVDVQAQADDTTYILSTIPAQEARRVFVEEFTGVSCPNCPAGHNILKAAKVAAGERMISVAYYKTGTPLTAPRPTTDDDFRMQLANDIDGTIFGGMAGSLPIAGVDRAVYSSKTLIDRALWSSTITNRLSVPAKANLTVTSTYDEATKKVKATITATFPEALDKKVYVTIGMYQDSIIDAQEDQVLGELEDYVHNHVFRQMITPTAQNGVELGTTGMYEAGRVYVRSFTADVNDPRYVAEHCRIFAVLHYMDGSSKEVLQAAEVHMK
ncbi:MAG: Omp28-related outer membrane protein [Flavipsychrobacter sp.]|nr:Omp28-related outer membrane protein [Flavipsychrobacter sp.]